MARANCSADERAGAARAEVPVKSGQFANTNHGQPAKPAVGRPIRADHNVKPTTQNQSHGGRQQERR